MNQRSRIYYTESPSLYGNPKKIIKLAVILLRIDHCAKSATPITAKIEDRNTESWEYSMPSNINKTSMKNPVIVRLIVLLIYFIR